MPCSKRQGEGGFIVKPFLYSEPILPTDGRRGGRLVSSRLVSSHFKKHGMAWHMQGHARREEEGGERAVADDGAGEGEGGAAGAEEGGVAGLPAEAAPVDRDHEEPRALVRQPRLLLRTHART